jgi:hypothetical protein
MRLAVLCLAVAVGIGPAHGQRKRDDTGAVARACGVNECFFERDVRGFEVIDRTHLIVYVGSQRCAFHVELSGTTCDMTFAPEIYFGELNDVQANVLTPGVTPQGGPASNPFEIERREQLQHDLQICRNDLTIQVHGGVFTETSSTNQPPDRFGNPRTECRVSSVNAITDDQLIEFYVTRGVAAPPPPMGAGEIEVGEQEEEGPEETSSSRGDDEGGR